MHTVVSAVQFAGPRNTWPDGHVYVGMPGKAASAFGIPPWEGNHGKPWSLLDGPDGKALWPVRYIAYLTNRLLTEPKYAEQVRDLHGKTLLCWCTAKEARRGTEVQCHARILAEYVELLFHAKR